MRRPRPGPRWSDDGPMDLDPTNWITDSWWSYLVIAAVITGSAVFPPLPSEGMLVTATGLALSSSLDPALVALATGSGALGGDLLAYTVGRASAARGGISPGSRVGRAIEWMRRREDTWLPALVVAGRYVPGGTTVVGLSAGALRYPWPRFLTLALLGVATWVVYGFAIAAAGRAAAPGSPWLSVVIGLSLVLLLSGAVHLVQRVRRRRRGSASAEG